MGFFKNIGKAVGGAVKSATKVVSINNIVKVATNPTSAIGIGKEAASRALQGAAAAVVKQPSATVQQLANVAPKAILPVTLSSGKTVEMTAKNAMVAEATAKGAASTSKLAGASDGNGILDWLKTAAGGAAASIGVKLAGTDPVNAAVNQTATSFGWAWIKKNAIAIGAVVVLIGGSIWYFTRGKKGTKRGF